MQAVPCFGCSVFNIKKYLWYKLTIFLLVYVVYHFSMQLLTRYSCFLPPCVILICPSFVSPAPSCNLVVAHSHWKVQIYPIFCSLVLWLSWNSSEAKVSPSHQSGAAASPPSGVEAPQRNTWKTHNDRRRPPAPPPLPRPRSCSPPRRKIILKEKAATYPVSCHDP